MNTTNLITGPDTSFTVSLPLSIANALTNLKSTESISDAARYALIEYVENCLMQEVSPSLHKQYLASGYSKANEPITGEPED